jgi:mannose-6-phosphate isomerase-like protein (cupin superfamily)
MSQTTRPENKNCYPQSLVVEPGEAKAYWQPLPSRGYVEVALSPHNTVYDDFCAGIQVLPPGCSVKEHGHARNHEVLFIYEGTGTCVIDEVEHKLSPGAVVLFSRDSVHRLHNTGSEDLKLFWVFMPPGLESWFETIGREKRDGDEMPPPFERPTDVQTVQDSLHFMKPKK